VGAPRARLSAIAKLEHRKGKAMQNVTDRSLALFLEYASDAGNWSGTPLVGGNVGGSKEDRGNLTQLKRSGLVTTDASEGHRWLIFTQAGRELARDHGIKIENY